MCGLLESREVTDEEKIEACYKEIFQKEKDFIGLQEDLMHRIKTSTDEKSKEIFLGDTFKILYEAFPAESCIAILTILLMWF